MNRRDTLIVGALVGAGLVLLLIPASRRRLRRVKDRALDAVAATPPAEEPARRGVDDGTLTERVQGALSRHISHPRALQVSCEDGVCTLEGEIRTGEYATMIRTAGSVPGVRKVVARVEKSDIPARA